MMYELPEPVQIDKHESGYVIRGYKAQQMQAAHEAGRASRDAEVAALQADLKHTEECCVGWATDYGNALKEVEALRADAERWKFTLWWQDQNPRPEHIQNCLTNMHRWARKRGALGPNSEELQLAVDHAMAARSK